MRFVVAAGILANTLPPQFQSDGNGIGIVEARESRKEFWQRLAANLPSESVSTARQGIRSRRRLLNKNIGTLKNIMNEKATPARPCDPDVGVLACGFGEFCDITQESQYGGVCVPPSEKLQRGLQESGMLTDPPATNTSESPTSAPVESATDSPTSSPVNATVTESGPRVYCDPNSPFYGELECGCDGWSVETLTGTFQCTLYAESCYEGCDDTCFSTDFTYYTDGSDISYQYCYDFISPFPQRFCFGYNNDQTCMLSLDGEMCTSCNTTYRLNCDYGSCYSEPCSIFDCDNVGLGVGNSCYDSIVPPVFDDCYRQNAGLYPSCSLCPDDAIIFPEAEFDLPGYGSFNCSYIGAIALYGALNPQQCTYATVLASNVCCESDEEPAFVCNLCANEDHVITNSDATVNIPSQPTVTCSNLQDVANEGLIEESQCGIVQGFTDGVCGCMHPDDTMTPTASPVTVPTLPGGSPATGQPTVAPASEASVSSTISFVVAATTTLMVSLLTD